MSPSSSTEVSRIVNVWAFPLTVMGNSLQNRTVTSRS